MRSLLVISVLVMNSLTFGCSLQYKSTDNEYLRYVGRGKVGVAYDVRVHNGFAYVTNNNGVVIFDVSQPENLREVGQIDIGTASFGIDLEKNSICIAGGNRLFIADITRPENPEKLGDIDLGGGLSQVRIEGQYAYVANRQKGFRIVDIINPKSPKIIGEFNNGGACEAVELADNTAYLADRSDGLEVIDISNPASPRLIATVPEAAGAWDISIDSTKDFLDLYVGCHGNGICIIRKTSESEYSILSRFNDGAEAQGVWYKNNTLFVADNFEFEILDVRDPESPKKIVEIERLNGLHDLYVEGKYIYLADAMKGLVVLEYMK